MYKLHTASSSESGIGEGDGEGSAVEDFFNNFVPRLSSLAQEDDEILDDPTIDLDAMAVCQPPPQKKMLRQQKQQQHHHHQSHRPKMIMANSNNSNNSNRDSNSSDSGRDLSMDEIGLIVGQLRSGGPYKDKLVAIMLKGLEKTLTSGVYRLFLEAGLPDNWCPIVKMNNDNTPFVEFLIKSDLSDQDPFSQLNEYSTEHMALCKFVVEQLHQNATRHTHPQLAAPSKRSLTPHHHQLQQKPKQQQQQLLVQQQKAQKQPQQQPQQKTQQKPQQQQQAPQQAPQQQAPQKQAPSQQPQQQPPQQQPTQQQQQPQLPKPKPLSLLQQTRSFGTPLACSTPKSEKQRILPPRACKSAKNHQKH